MGSESIVRTLLALRLRVLADQQLRLGEVLGGVLQRHLQETAALINEAADALGPDGSGAHV